MPGYAHKQTAIKRLQGVLLCNQVLDLLFVLPMRNGWNNRFLFGHSKKLNDISRIRLWMSRRGSLNMVTDA